MFVELHKVVRNKEKNVVNQQTWDLVVSTYERMIAEYSRIHGSPISPHTIDSIDSVALSEGEVILDDSTTKTMPETTEHPASWVFPNCSGDPRPREKLGVYVVDGSILYGFDQDLTLVSDISVHVTFVGSPSGPNYDLITNNSVQMGKGTVGPFQHPAVYFEEDKALDTPPWKVQYITAEITKNHYQTPITAYALIDAHLVVTWHLGDLGNPTYDFWLHDIKDVGPKFQTVQFNGTLFSDTVANQKFADENDPIQAGDPLCQLKGVQRAYPSTPWAPDQKNLKLSPGRPRRDI
jgi:hypothetical protein